MTPRYVAFLRCLLATATLLFGSTAWSDSDVRVAPASVGLDAAKLDEIRDYFQSEIDNGTEPGIRLLIARRGQVVVYEDFGVKNTATGEKMADDTLFRIASFTKPVTNAAAMVLWDQGKIQLDDPIAKYLPELGDADVYAGVDDDGEMVTEPANRPATIFDLMLHSAGYTYGGLLGGEHPVNAVYAKVNPADAEIDADEAVRRFGQVPLAYQPGTDYRYSFSTDLLGILIERVSGQDLPGFMQEHIFAPLGMYDTMPWVPADKLSRLMPIHTVTEEGDLVPLPFTDNGIWERDPATYEALIFSGGGGLVSTPTDYFRFAEMLRRGGELKGKRVLSEAAVELLTTAQAPQGRDTFLWAPGQGLGLNLSVVTDPSKIPYPTSAGEFSHGGLFNGYFLVDPALELVVIMQGQRLPPRYRPHHIQAVMPLLHEAIID